MTAPAAQAGSLAVDTPCPPIGGLTQPFTPWADSAFYALSPAGNFEGKLPNWTLSGGAKAITGNETFNVGAKSDTHSLKLPAGSSATSAPICVGVDYPSARFFLRNTGDPAATLKVEVLGAGALGDVREKYPSSLTATSAWSPSPVIWLVDNLMALTSGTGTTPVAFRFTPQGGTWQIDDVYVDPYRRG